jgi:hypothetical protein
MNARLNLILRTTAARWSANEIPKPKPLKIQVIQTKGSLDAQKPLHICLPITAVRSASDSKESVFTD